MSAGPITVVGSVNLDLVIRTEKLPLAGETVLGSEFATHPGGKGANQALAAQRLGAQLRLIAAVGDDSEARTALALLHEGGVDLRGIATYPQAKTGVALISVDPSGENQIVVAPGANACLTPDDLPDQIGRALIAQNEVSLATLEAAVQRCEGFVALNLAPAMVMPDTMLARADLLIVNETEAEFYGRERLLASGGRVAVTLGARGAILYDAGAETAKAVPPKVDVVDATGAGDAFVAALTVAFLEGHSDHDALRFACAAGAAATTRAGAQPALPERADVEARISRTGP